MFSKAIRANRGVLAASSAAASAWLVSSNKSRASSSSSSKAPFIHLSHHHHHPLVHCESNDDTTATRNSSIRKRNSLLHANETSFNRNDTRAELSKLRTRQTAIMRQWEQDEDGWRSLPARAWPEYQPNPEQLGGIEQKIEQNGCYNAASNQYDSEKDVCRTLLFHLASGLVFYSVDPAKGFQLYQSLANQGHVDSMVACGVVLVEGLLGNKGNNQEAEGIEWFRKALHASNQSSKQAFYELGTAYYAGIDGVIEEDAKEAFRLFEEAAKLGHVGAMYMTADCLIEGEGCEVDVAQAIPLLYRAADQGHRFARQRIRELLKDPKYQSA